MRKITRLLLPPGLIVAAILFAGGLYLLRPAPEQVKIVRQPLLINVAEVVKQDIRVRVRSHGTVAPRMESVLSAEVAGRIVEIADNFRAGGFFRHGDLMLRIDDRNYRADVARAAAAVAAARSELAQEQGRARVAEEDWIRAGRPRRNPASHALALRQPQLTEAQAHLDSALAELDFAREQLDRTRILAPYTGILRNESVGLGQYVSVGAALADMFAIDYAEVRLPLPMARLDYLELPNALQAGQKAAGLESAGLVSAPSTPVGNTTASPPVPPAAPPVQVQLYVDGADGLQAWPARLVRTEGVIDPERRVLFAVAAVSDPYRLGPGPDSAPALAAGPVSRYAMHPESSGRHSRGEALHQAPLRMGTFVTASIEGRLMRDLVILPRSVLRAGNQLWVVDAQGRLQNREVEVLRTDGEMIYIRAGLDEGERVALSSLNGAVDGVQVRAADVMRTDQLQAEPVTGLPDGPQLQTGPQPANQPPRLPQPLTLLQWQRGSPTRSTAAASRPEPPL